MSELSGMEESINRKNPVSSGEGQCPQCGVPGKRLESKYATLRLCENSTCKQIVF